MAFNHPASLSCNIYCAQVAVHTVSVAQVACLSRTQRWMDQLEVHFCMELSLGEFQIFSGLGQLSEIQYQWPLPHWFSLFSAFWVTRPDQTECSEYQEVWQTNKLHFIRSQCINPWAKHHISHKIDISDKLEPAGLESDSSGYSKSSMFIATTLEYDRSRLC